MIPLTVQRLTSHVSWVIKRVGERANERALVWSVDIQGNTFAAKFEGDTKPTPFCDPAEFEILPEAHRGKVA